MSRRTRTVLALVGVLAIGGVAAAFAVSASDVVAVEVADVTTEDLSIVVSAAGAVQADERIDVYPPTAGVLASVTVTEGDEVRAGQVLAIMDTAPIEIQVAQAEAAYKAAMAQRDAISAAVPGAGDRAAAQAAVDAASAAYSAADAAYDAAVAGLGAPTATEIAQAEAAVAVASASAEAARAAYDAYYNDVYLPAPLPRDAATETALAALRLARDQADAALADATAALAALQAAANNAPTVASAKIARDQAYAAYLGAVAQKDALTKAADTSGARASADAAVAAAEAALAYANDTLARAEIVAPSDGVVLFSGSSGSALLSAAGAGAAAPELGEGATVSPAAPVFSIVAFDALTFEAQVDETDVTRIEPGMTAVISLDAFSDLTFDGEVERVGKESVLTVTGGTAFPVELRFRPESATVLLGMNGAAEIEVETIGNVTTIPVEALLEDADSAYVYVVRDGRARRVDIEAGRMTDTRVEVVSGLSAGETVVVSGVATLSDGARVKAE